MTNHEPAHTLSYTQLGVVIGALFILTAVTIGASYVHMGALNVWIALVIASSKASLVLLYFMHLKFESRVIRLSFVCTIVFLAIMIGFTFWDTAFR